MNELKSWSDLANNYDMILFNECTSINEGAVLMEWLESHQCEAQEASYHIDTCEAKNCKKCKEYKADFGECPECECEPYQWYAFGASEYDVDKLNEMFDLDIFYSDTLGIYILPVYHFGTSWRIMGLKGGYCLEEN